MKRNRKGFTLIELLIVVAIIGIIVAIAIPNLLNAIQRAKQKRTMADMRSIGTAVEAYAIDHNFYPPAAAATTAFPSGITAPGTDVTGANIQPIYIAHVPVKDGWNKAFQYNYYPTAVSTASVYSLLSYGKDGTVEGVNVAGATTSFNSDIIFANGQFTRYPEGVQQ